MRVLFDSSVWVSYFHIDDVHHDEAHSLVYNALANADQILVPELVYVEVLNTIWRLTKSSQEVDKCKAVFHDASPLVKLRLSDEAFWFEYVEKVMKRINLKSSDLIIAAYALQAKLRFETFDKPLRREIDKVL